MDYPLAIRLAAECVGTAILILFGNGAVAGVSLKGSKTFHSEWTVIAAAYGFGVMVPGLMFGSISGAHINPAMTIGQAVMGLFPWSEVLPYILAQCVGAVIGQLLVYAAYKPYYDRSEDAEAIFGTFATFDAADSRLNYFVNEFIGTMALGVCAMTCLNSDWGTANRAVAIMVVGMVIWGLIYALGGPTGPCLNPARDLMPRILHMLLPIEHKGPSRWNEAWIPIVAPILGGTTGIALFTFFS
ncbi:aquaporin [Bifidobacterium callitrichos]|uniref:Aquaporin n=1 Tax=Bifidobacterium callitrichos TaxID=762209 RepID=A0A2T3GD66_9BIFI|nr:MIP/aquaporin family protein [Bifidobacterium callitrichos]KAA8815792.1 aquaporin family protein [Bifidobacterium callitrichos]PST47413.1 aquaporin [Bifidobacterium callitrichos]